MNKYHWPSILWHFFDGANKDDPEKQYDSFHKNVFRKTEKSLNFGFSKTDSNGITARCLCLTSLPSETLDKHSNKYGRFVFGFNRKRLTDFCEAKKYILNPVLYNYKNHHFSEKINSLLSTLPDLSWQLHTILEYYDDNRATEDCKKFDPTQLCNNFEKKEVQKAIVEILGCLDALSCLTKPIREDDPYDYYVEQEWRMVIPYLHQSNRVFMGRGIESGEKIKRIYPFEDIPFEVFDCIVCPDSDYKEKMAKSFENLQKNFKIISFDELHDFLKERNSLKCRSTKNDQNRIEK